MRIVKVDKLDNFFGKYKASKTGCPIGYYRLITIMKKPDLMTIGENKQILEYIEKWTNSNEFFYD